MKDTSSPRIELSAALLLAAVTVLANGCASTALDPAPRASRTPSRPRPMVEQPLARPHSFKMELARPSALVYQSFRWNRDGLAWDVDLPRLEDAYASVLFRKTYDMSTDQDTRWITFQMKPASMAPYIGLGLMDSTKDPSSANLSAPLSGYQIGEQDGWGYYLIRVDEFRRHGQLADASLHARSPGNLDWTQVRGIKLNRTKSDGPARMVTLKDLSFQTHAYRLPQSYAMAF